MNKAKYIGIGLALGLIFDVAMHTYGIGMLLGVALGAGIWAVQQRRQSRRAD